MSKILVSVRVRADPGDAFDVFTRDVALWWQPNRTFRFTPREGGVLSFEPREGGRFIETLPSGTVFEIGKIKVWEPGRRLVFGWRQATFTKEQNTEVEVSFEAIGDETRVTVEHRGWDSVPQTHVARHTFPDMLFLERHAGWWRTLLAAMAKRAA